MFALSGAFLTMRVFRLDGLDGGFAPFFVVSGGLEEVAVCGGGYYTGGGVKPVFAGSVVSRYYGVLWQELSAVVGNGFVS